MKRRIITLSLLVGLTGASLIAGDDKGNSDGTVKKQHDKTLLLIKTQSKRPLSPSNQTIEVSIDGDILTFDITENMGMCTVFVGEREAPVETYAITSDDSCISVAGIEDGEYPLILVTEGYQIFRGTIEI